jgi:hypothetical protein
VAFSICTMALPLRIEISVAADAVDRKVIDKVVRATEVSGNTPEASSICTPRASLAELAGVRSWASSGMDSAYFKIFARTVSYTFTNWAASCGIGDQVDGSAVTADPQTVRNKMGVHSQLPIRTAA